MIKCTLLSCSGGASIDMTTRSASIFDIIEAIQSASMPVFIQNLVVLFMLYNDSPDNNDVDIKLKLIVGGDMILEIPNKINFQSNKRIKTAVRLQSIVLNKVGVFEVILEVGGSEKGSYAFDVNYIGKVIAANTPSTGATQDAPEQPKP